MQKTVVLLLTVIILLFTGCAANPPSPKPLPPRAADGQQPQAQHPVQSVPPSNPDVNAIYQQGGRFNGEVGLFAKNLKTGASLSYYAEKVFPTASTHKLVVALAVYKYLYSDAPVEKKKQYDQQIKAMMVVSDNPAFYSLLREIEQTKPQALTQVLTDLGLIKTRIHSSEAFRQYGYHSVTTSAEMATVFETIYNETYLGAQMSAMLKEELAKTKFNTEIPRFMNNNKVMHKVGSLPGVLCDVGIVDDGRDVILISAYTTTKGTEEYASKFIADISAKSYNALRSK